MDQLDNLKIEFDDNLNQLFKTLEEMDNKFPTFEKKFSYGTTGFRYNEKLLYKVNLFIE